MTGFMRMVGVLSTPGIFEGIGGISSDTGAKAYWGWLPLPCCGVCFLGGTVGCRKQACGTD